MALDMRARANNYDGKTSRVMGYTRSGQIVLLSYCWRHATFLFLMNQIVSNYSF